MAMHHISVLETGKRSRFEFAHALRGIAALSVIVSHFIGVFWANHKDVMDLIGLPPLAKLPSLPGIIQAIVDVRLIIGQFGVGIFFVLSGFVISFSIEREPVHTFALRRLMRIYPIYVAGFLLAMTGLWLFTWLSEVTFKYTLIHMAVHTMILLRGMVGYMRIDGISWTLEIEVVFYILMIAFGRIVLRHALHGICVSASVVLVLSIVFIMSDTNGFVGVQFSCGLMLLCGLTYALHALGRLSNRQLVGSQLSLAVILSLAWLLISRSLGISLQWLCGYLISLAVFAFCYAFWRYQTVHSRVLNHVADVSYPLYVVHGLLGYAIMHFVILHTGYAYLAIVVAFLTTYGLSILLHLSIEQPFIDWSRSLTTPAMKPTELSRRTGQV